MTRYWRIKNLITSHYFP